MPFTPDLVAELNLLALFNLHSIQEGIKVHQHSATPDAVAAAERLHRKGLTTQIDGGYLTQLGIEAAEHAQRVLGILRSE
ncbi:TIGR02647 family protein [Marinobacter nanhaiticus D15-8W]|uniref:TIGR02647 family protein n=1 Tax=Marinobacter nanhaiticus D15-8W TaxID=626887 RepID=N6X554_9GAMM|nr:TIGR02647 family protein [Marinobacter nanhaiticus]ENO16188.1 TIGR02647 family protein [Marinobacter nanhaiticus D15-8W]BES72955.1 TIGR02647 family protein [Marinobacter nanhaiticus D15-8W]